MSGPHPYSASAIAKARRVLSIPLPGEIDVAVAFEAIRASLEEHACGLTGASDRDIERIDASLQGVDAVFVGYAGDRARLLVSLTFDRQERAAEITIRATKGAVDITEVDWGSQGPHVGNRALVARLLHLGIVTLRRVGVRFLRNKPWNARLRSLYSAMGFRNGEELDLDDLDAISKAFDHIERHYGRFGLSMADP